MGRGNCADISSLTNLFTAKIRLNQAEFGWKTGERKLNLLKSQKGRESALITPARVGQKFIGDFGSKTANSFPNSSKPR